MLANLQLTTTRPIYPLTLSQKPVTFQETGNEKNTLYYTNLERIYKLNPY
jgi:hypothetical protein